MSADLDDSIAVDLVTYALYGGWLAVLSGAALWLGVPPLPRIQEAFTVPWQGTVTAVGTGVAFLAASRWVYDRLRSRNAPEAEPPPVPVPEPEPPEPEPADAPRRKKRKKRKKKKR